MEERVLCKECIKFIDKPLNFEQSQKDGCWLCNGIFEEINSLAELVIKKLSSYEYSTFLIGSKFDNDILGRAKELGIDIKGKFNEKIGLVVSKALKKNPDFKKPDIMAIVDTNYNVVNLQIRSICIYGRYIKLVRGIPQTRYYKKCFEKIYETSVEEEIGKKILFYANGTNYKFHGMGREDIDARMLGNGRPFILEVINPKIRNIDLESIRSEINESRFVNVNSLRFCEKEEIMKMKSRRNYKTYRAIVEFDSELSEEKVNSLERQFNNVKITQLTPKRVEHRRARIARVRTIKEVRVNSVDHGRGEFLIKGECGAYIKEFIHGDMGRTVPNIADYLGEKCKIVSLDVVTIHDGEECGDKF